MERAQQHMLGASQPEQAHAQHRPAVEVERRVPLALQGGRHGGLLRVRLHRTEIIDRDFEVQRRQDDLDRTAGNVDEVRAQALVPLDDGLHRAL